MVLYEDFLKTLEENNVNVYPIMTHKPSSINLAKRLFEGYLTEEELSERQYSGRFWDIQNYILFITLDNETILVVHDTDTGIKAECECDRCNMLNYLPDSLRGRYYN